jgi:hypothetical protein
MSDWRFGKEYYQEQILRCVSRTFALTIPQLPTRLRTPVANAYLLCRIADTIKDESALSTAAKWAFLRRFVAVVRGTDVPDKLVSELLPQFSYTLLIPVEKTGIRRFCLWAIGLALLTLRNMERRPYFTSGEQAKVSHAGVIATQGLSSVAVRHGWMLIRLFQSAARGLPLASVDTARRSSPANHPRGSDAFVTLGQIR